jgi:hypothetical protein
MIIYGKRLYGTVERVPGVLYVATQFFHLYFIPVAPVESFVIVEGSEVKDGFRGAKTGFNAKSILATYAKTALFLTGGVLMIAGGVQSCDVPHVGSDHPLVYLWFLGFGSVLIGACFLWRPWSTATEARARELAEKLGISRDAVDNWLDQKKHTA